MIKLLIVDDHAVVRQGMRNLLEDETDIEVVGEAGDGEEAMQKISELMPNVVLLDLTMPRVSGFEVAKAVSEKFENVKTLIFSMHNNQEYMVQAVENGAMGYLLKDMNQEEILKAIRSVSAGKLYFPPTVSALIIEAFLEKRPLIETKKSETSLKNLSKQEKIILEYIVEGLSSQEIANKLGLSVRTVSNHRANMMKKANVKNTAELVKLAVS